MVKEMVFGIVGGLGLFLFGMGILSEGLKKVAGQRLRKFLAALTKHRVIAVLVGAATTCLIQSSSATTVMTIGLVNAGLLTLKQALCVVLGANIGTTFTAWLVSGFAVFKITSYALPAIGVGFLLNILGGTQKTRNVGQVLLGFGILFIGINFMKEAFGPLEESAKVRSALIWVGSRPILAVLAGTLITMLLQSSSASIAMVQLLAFGGAFGVEWNEALRIAIPFILGDNIGTTITAQLAALRTSVNSRRAAMGHTLFNAIGVAYMLPLVSTGWFADFVEFVTPMKLSQNTIMVHIAVAHSCFNVVNTMIFLPAISWLEFLVKKLVPAKDEMLAGRAVALEEHLLKTPVIAMDQARREIVRMAQTAGVAVNQAIEGLLKNGRRELDAARQTEDLVDNFQFEITSYLAALSGKELPDKLTIALPVLLHTVNDLERIADHAVNIVEIAERKVDQKLSFSEEAESEIEQLKNEVNQMLERIIVALENDDAKAATEALDNENALNRMQIEFRRSHVQRMTEGLCSAEAGLIFIDLVDNVEKIGDHLTNIAQSVVGGLQWDGVEAQ
jgi:phosphate:Na+ symporter